MSKEGRISKASRCRELVLECDKKFGGELSPKDMVFKIMSELNLSHVTATNYLYNARRHIAISRGAPVPEWLVKMNKKKSISKKNTTVSELSEAA